MTYFAPVLTEKFHLLFQNLFQDWYEFGFGYKKMGLLNLFDALFNNFRVSNSVSCLL